MCCLFHLACVSLSPGLFASLHTDTVPLLRGCQSTVVAGSVLSPRPYNGTADPDSTVNWSSYLQGDSTTLTLEAMVAPTKLETQLVQAVFASRAILAGRSQPLLGGFNVSSIVVTPSSTNENQIALHIAGSIGLSDPFGSDEPFSVQSMQIQASMYGDNTLLGTALLRLDLTKQQRIQSQGMANGSEYPSDVSWQQNVEFTIDTGLTPVGQPTSPEAWCQFIAAVVRQGNTRLQITVRHTVHRYGSRCTRGLEAHSPGGGYDVGYFSGGLGVTSCVVFASQAPANDVLIVVEAGTTGRLSLQVPVSSGTQFTGIRGLQRLKVTSNAVTGWSKGETSMLSMMVRMKMPSSSQTGIPSPPHPHTQKCSIPDPLVARPSTPTPTHRTPCPSTHPPFDSSTGSRTRQTQPWIDITSPA